MICVNHLVATVDEVDIDLIGTKAVHQFLGAAGAELLGLVTVDDEERRGGNAMVGGGNALLKKTVSFLNTGVEVGLAVHQVLIEGDA